MEIWLIGDRSQGNSALPGNEIGLAFGFGASEDFAAGGANHEIENVFAHLFDGGFAGDDRAGINIYAVGHFCGEVGVGGEFNDRGDGIAGGSTETGREKNDVGAGADLCSDAFDVVAGRALEL